MSLVDSALEVSESGYNLLQEGVADDGNRLNILGPEWPNCSSG